MDIKKLKAFSVVAEFGSFSRAAAVQGVVQPMLSRQVRSLEEELGVQLVHRNGRGIVLTEAGSLLNEYAKGILATLARAESEVGALRANPRGNVVIGMPPSMGSVLTVPLIQKFRSEHPSINMRVIEGFSGYLLEWLLTGKIDVAVLYNAPRTKSLLSEPLLEEELFLIGAANDPSALPPGPIKAKRLAELPLILPSRPHGLRLLIDQALSGAGIIRQRRAGGGCAAGHHQAGGEACRLHHPFLFAGPRPDRGRPHQVLGHRRASLHARTHHGHLQPTADYNGDARVDQHGAQPGARVGAAGSVASEDGGDDREGQASHDRVHGLASFARGQRLAGQGLRCSRMLESTVLTSRRPHRAMVMSSSLRMMSSDVVTPAWPMAPRP